MVVKLNYFIDFIGSFLFAAISRCKCSLQFLAAISSCCNFDRRSIFISKSVRTKKVDCLRKDKEAKRYRGSCDVAIYPEGFALKVTKHKRKSVLKSVFKERFSISMPGEPLESVSFVGLPFQRLSTCFQVAANGNTSAVTFDVNDLKIASSLSRPTAKAGGIWLSRGSGETFFDNLFGKHIEFRIRVQHFSIYIDQSVHFNDLLNLILY